MITDKYLDIDRDMVIREIRQLLPFYLALSRMDLVQKCVELIDGVEMADEDQFEAHLPRIVKDIVQATVEMPVAGSA